MQLRRRKPILAVVSPFIDKRHGTERCIAEQIAALAKDYEIHLYSSRVEDLPPGSVIWHRVFAVRGPEVFRFLWWFAGNAVVRWRDRVRGLRPDVVYSPGPNCLRPDIVSVHALFTRIRQSSRTSPADLTQGSPSFPVRAHRWLYYRMAEKLERAVYRRRKLRLLAVSRKTEADLRTLFGTTLHTNVAYHGVDPRMFAPANRRALRRTAREELGLREGSVAMLLIGNDWANKGLGALVQAARAAGDQRICIFAVGTESVQRFISGDEKGTRITVQPLPPRSDVEFYYAAADIYASPSLEDSFGLPVLEAMACGLPVITSRAAGVSEIIHHGEDGLVLEDPKDIATLARYLQELVTDAGWRERLGENAARTASRYTWERNAAQLRDVIEEVLARHGV